MITKKKKKKKRKTKNMKVKTMKMTTTQEEEEEDKKKKKKIKIKRSCKEVKEYSTRGRRAGGNCVNQTVTRKTAGLLSSGSTLFSRRTRTDI